MSFIGMSMTQVPEHMKDVVTILNNDTAANIKDNLPIYLKHIWNIANQGQGKVTTVLEKFDLAINTLNEVIEANQDVRGENEQILADTKMYRSIAEREEKEFQKELERCQEEMEKMKKQIEEEEKDLKKSLDSAGSWDDLAHQAAAAGMDTLKDCVVPTLAMAGGMSMMAATMSNVESGVAAGAMVLNQGIKTGAQFLDSMTSSKATSNNDKQQDLLRDLLASASRIEDGVCNSLEKLFKNEELSLPAMKDEHILKEAELVLEKEEKAITDLQGKMSNPSSAKTLKDTKNKLKRLMKDMRNAEKEENPNKYPDMYDKLNECRRECETFQMATTAANDGSLGEAQSPLQMRMANAALGGASKTSLSDTYVKQMFTKLEIQKEQLRSTEKRADETRDRKMAQNRKLLETISDIAKFKETEATKQEVLQIITKGLAALYEMRKQWKQLYLYFKNIENVIQTVMGPSMSMFIDLSEVAAKRMVTDGERMSILASDRLYKQAFKAVRIAHVVHFMASSYERISNDHLMPMIEHFGEIVSLDGHSDKEKIKEKMKKLESDGKNAQDAIAVIIDEGHSKLKTTINKRQIEIEQIFESHLPALPEEERKQIALEAKEMMDKVTNNTEKDDIDDYC